MTEQLDLILVGGAVLVILALPIFVATLAERRIAWVSMILTNVGAGLMIWVLRQVPDASWQTLVDASIRVIARII